MRGLLPDDDSSLMTRDERRALMTPDGTCCRRCGMLPCHCDGDVPMLRRVSWESNRARRDQTYVQIKTADLRRLIELAWPAFPESARGLGNRIAINRNDEFLPLAVRAAIMDAMSANGDFARADERHDEATEVYMRRAQAAEGELCDAIEHELYRAQHTAVGDGHKGS